MEMINQTLIMSFLGMIAVSSIVFPILFLVQRRKQHREWMQWLEMKDKINLKMDFIDNFKNDIIL